MTCEFWLPPVPNVTVGSGWSSMAWSPVVATTCAFGPIGVKGTDWLPPPPPQATKLRTRKQSSAGPGVGVRTIADGNLILGMEFTKLTVLSTTPTWPKNLCPEQCPPASLLFALLPSGQVRN